MAEWAQLVMLVVIAALMIETRWNLGNRVALMQRDMQWLLATLQRWGFPSPDHDMAIRLAAENDAAKRAGESKPARG
jgi:hypothetical protein